MEYKITQDRGCITDMDVLKLIHESFAEHSNRGINFTCSSYSIEHVNQLLSKSIVFYAISESGDLLGLSACHETTKGHYYGDITCISPTAKGLGIGTELYQLRKNYLIERSAVCMMSDTAVQATSSVKWHLHKCGCKIVGFHSFTSTNYYSYVFREDFFKRNFLITHVYYPFHFICQFAKCVLLKKKDGTDTLLYKTLKRVI